MPLLPFGELRSVTSYNRDPVIYEMESRLPIDTDMDNVRKIIKRIGQDLLHDPDHGQNLLSLISQGIHRIEETAIILRTKFTCKPRSLHHPREPRTGELRSMPAEAFGVSANPSRLPGDVERSSNRVRFI